MSDFAERICGVGEDVAKTVAGCTCHKCMARVGLRYGWFKVCPQCGCKRCPHASDHELACTGSNEAGQPGSVFVKS